MISLLANNPILLLFLICGVGFTAGRISISGFSFGVAAVLFVGIGAGAVSATWILPDDVWTFGLAIFVYTTGLACGPSFLRTIRRRGLPLNTAGIGVVALGAAVAAGMAALVGLSAACGAGVFAGAATTSPGLAAIVGYMQAHSPPDVVARLGAAPVIGYSLTYPLGVLIPLLICSALLRHDPAKRRRLVERTALVEDVEGVTLRELADHLHHRVAFGRVYHKGKLIAADRDYEVRKGDRLTLNGKREDVIAALEVVGEMIDDKTVAFDHSKVDSRRVVVSDHSLAGARLGDVDLSGYRAVVTRVRRGDTDMVAHPDLMLELGDHVRLVAPRRKLRKASRVFGDSYRSLNELDVLPFAFGIAGGMLLGLIPFPLPGGGTLTARLRRRPAHRRPGAGRARPHRPSVLAASRPRQPGRPPARRGAASGRDRHQGRTGVREHRHQPVGAARDRGRRRRHDPLQPHRAHGREQADAALAGADLRRHRRRLHPAGRVRVCLAEHV